MTSTTLRRTRNPFPGEYFFTVPLRLFDDGILRDMRGAELKRYLTLLRLANYRYGKKSIRHSLDNLAMLDGVSSRAAWLVHRKLAERGLITIELTRPRTIHLVEPTYWPEPGEKNRISQQRNQRRQRR